MSLQEFAVHVTEEFMEHCAEGALSMEVWGHRSLGFGAVPGWEMDQVHAKSRSIMDRWVIYSGIDISMCYKSQLCPLKLQGHEMESVMGMVDRAYMV